MTLYLKQVILESSELKSKATIQNTFTRPKPKRCFTCRGSGKDPKGNKCPDCNGSGWWT